LLISSDNAKTSNNRDNLLLNFYLQKLLVSVFYNCYESINVTVFHLSVFHNALITSTRTALVSMSVLAVTKIRYSNNLDPARLQLSDSLNTCTLNVTCINILHLQSSKTISSRLQQCRRQECQYKNATDSENELTVLENDRSLWGESELTQFRTAVLQSAGHGTDGHCSAVGLQLPCKVDVILAAVGNDECLL